MSTLDCEYIYDFESETELVTPKNIVTLDGYKIVILRNNYAVIYDTPEDIFVVPKTMLDTNKMVNIKDFCKSQNIPIEIFKNGKQVKEIINLLNEIKKTELKKNQSNTIKCKAKYRIINKKTDNILLSIIFSF